MARKLAKKLVFVGMSGGVDSSVCAALLKDQGYDVVGVHLRCWNVDGCAEQDAEDARRAAETIGIPFYVFNFEKEYKEQVVAYMVRGYKQGITPNPDVACNHEIKFGLFFKRAMQLGADYVATGHYARIKKNRKGSFSLFAGVDKNKDQSYFLWTLTQAQLAKTLFPVGDLIKHSQVRVLAKKFNLPNAEKKDSQGICFIGQVTLPEFLSTFIARHPGPVLNTAGEKIGEHVGAEFYTIGQRKGVGVSGSKNPVYVAAKDLARNIVTVAAEGDPIIYQRGVVLTEVNFVAQSPANLPLPVRVRLRYRQPLFKANLEYSGKQWRLVFEAPQKFVAPGQSAVFYDGMGAVLGGGVILNTA